MNRKNAALLTAIAGALLVGQPSSAGVQRDAKVLAEAQSARTKQLDLLEQIVNIDSGTGDVEGGRKVTAQLTPYLHSLGMTVESIPAEEPGLPENTVATVTGHGRTRILMIGHLDTVFEPGTAQRRAFHIVGGRAYGPGVGDEKGGVVEAIYALQILHDLRFKNFGKIVLLMETSEERGSPGTNALIGKLLKEADVELNLEPGDTPDTITVWRKGVATFHIDVKGRAAHAGIAPQEGRNAAIELMHQLSGLNVFPTFGPGLTVNLTVMHAGTRFNIIPEDASALVNVRVREKGDLDRVEQTLLQNAETTIIPDTKVTISREAAYPPLADNPKTRSLAGVAQRIYTAIGRILATGGNGGGSESALAADAGVPTLDGLGPVGGGFHSDQEYTLLDTVTPRLYLLTRLLMELGDSPTLLR